MLLGHMDIQQRFRCALVCSEWAKAAAGATYSIVKHDIRHELDLARLQQWLKIHGSQVKMLHLHGRRFTLARLPCAQLQDFLVHGPNLGSRVWDDLAAATKLTSVSFKDVCTTSRQADVVAALTALPDLQHLTWHWLTCHCERELSDSRLLQHLTKLTGLELCCLAEKALQHLSLLSKLQHLHLYSPVSWAAANFPSLQELTGLTSLGLYYDRRSLPASISRLTALQQLEVSSASAAELNGLTRLTVLTELHVMQLMPEITSLQLPALQYLQLTGLPSLEYPDMHISTLSGCSQLQKLSLYNFSLTGPGSLAACSMLQELDLNNCIFGSDSGPASLSCWEEVFPGPAQLPHLTSLVLQSVYPFPEPADVELLVACCSGLQALQYGTDWWKQVCPNTAALQGLPDLTKLHLATVSDGSCSSLAQLTGLRELQVVDPGRLSSAGLRHLARLEQLTSLGFCRGFSSIKNQQEASEEAVRCLARLQACPREQGSTWLSPNVAVQLLRSCPAALR